VFLDVSLNHGDFKNTQKHFSKKSPKITQKSTHPPTWAFFFPAPLEEVGLWFIFIYINTPQRPLEWMTSA
jgi:hypothetical protein